MPHKQPLPDRLGPGAVSAGSNTDEDTVDTAETAPEGDAQQPQAPDASPWFHRVLPVTGLLVALITLGALLSPAFREQVALSTSRQPQPYVELFFPRTTPSRAPATCIRRGETVRVRFVVVSHLGERQAIAYRVRINPKGNGLSTRRKAGSVRLEPGSSRVVRKRFVLPRDTGYRVSVALPTLDQQVRAHCRGRG